jgi:hypothetical protein
MPINSNRPCHSTMLRIRPLYSFVFCSLVILIVTSIVDNEIASPFLVDSFPLQHQRMPRRKKCAREYRSGGLESTSTDSCRKLPLDAHHQDKIASWSDRRRPSASLSRRQLLVATAFVPRPAVAATPITLRETDSIGAIWERQLLRPKPIQLLRSPLNQDFGVLLMRSSYNALDQLDCVPMDQFQRDFFLVVSVCTGRHERELDRVWILRVAGCLASFMDSTRDKLNTNRTSSSWVLVLCSREYFQIHTTLTLSLMHNIEQSIVKYRRTHPWFSRSNNPSRTDPVPHHYNYPRRRPHQEHCRTRAFHRNGL